MNEKIFLETECLEYYGKKLYAEKVDAWQEKALHGAFAQEIQEPPPWFQICQEMTHLKAWG